MLSRRLIPSSKYVNADDNLPVPIQDASSCGDVAWSKEGQLVEISVSSILIAMARIASC